MEVGLHVPRFDWAGGPPAIRDTLGRLADAAEAAGCRHLSVMDHYFQMDRMFAVDEPMLEAYATLSFVAARTERLKLHVLATGVTYRHPGLLAKVLTTLDILSAGRAELAIGAAWYEREHLGLGVPFPALGERFERLEEAIQICLQMWSGEVAPYEGAHYRLAETLGVPRPLARPRPRLIVCGGGERRTLRIAAQYADESNVVATSAEQVERKRAILDGHCAAIGRDAAEVGMSVLYGADTLIRGERDAFIAEMRAFAARGVDTVIVMPLVADPVAFVQRLGSDVVPALAEL